MRFYVLGLGPVGSLVAHHLRRTIPRNPEIVLIHRNREQASKAGNSIQVETNGVRTKSTGFRSEFTEGTGFNPHPKSLGPNGTVHPDDPLFIQSLIVTCKAHQTLPAIRRLSPRLSTTSTIVLLQNGMGMYEELVTEVFPNPSYRPHLILATNTHGAYLTQDRVVHAGLGNITFGIMPEVNGRDFEASSSMHPSHNLSINDITKPGDPEYERYEHLRSTVAALQLLEGLNASWQPISKVQLAMRRKLVVNSIVNPVTCLLRCLNGDVLRLPDMQDLTKRVCAEAAEVFSAQFEAETRGQDGGEGHGRLPPALQPANLVKEVQRVVKATALNKSSMLADIERGRPTEIDYINGYLMRLAQMYNVQTPATASLYNLVKMRSALPLDR
ncbi:hypothetical protein D9611_005639 [Ephemerocybe angulata]|uniref:2-dehydropantoate 2-reductase n=1 Tax=Ephemerocybe angulata TaxID=980116 RepID=A0A8H5F4Q4_9AGAR|nr:hypothetical protein D9611_005639 [Tulosesus angulatus]